VETGGNPVAEPVDRKADLPGVLAGGKSGEASGETSASGCSGPSERAAAAGKAASDGQERRAVQPSAQTCPVHMNDSATACGWSHTLWYSGCLPTAGGPIRSFRWYMPALSGNAMSLP